ncbi:MAG: alpha/beta fold hydrolase [Gaiellaceae bacterium]
MRLSTYEWGDMAGPPVICLHGVTGHGARFEQLATRLPAFRVVGVDLRGHGHSGSEPPWGIATHIADLIETAGALGIETATWVGHSFGGRIVAELSAAAPELVGSAVLLDPALRIEADIALASAEGLRPDTSFATLDDAVDAKLADGTLFTTPRSILEDEMTAHFEEGADGRWRARFSRVAAIVAWSEMAAAAPPFPEQPALLVLGARSWITNTVVPESPHLEVVTVAGGHSVLWDDFDDTAAAVAGFLR